VAVLLLFAAVLLPAGLCGLVLVAGIRTGDRPADACLVGVQAAAEPGLLQLSVRNPGGSPILVGASVRRPRLRLRLSAGVLVRVPRRTTRARLLASRQATLVVVSSGATATLLVPAPPLDGTYGELVAVIGQPRRLRVVHRRVRLPPPASTPIGSGPVDADRYRLSASG
jgi:hypothetical protein